MNLYIIGISLTLDRYYNYIIFDINAASKFVQMIIFNFMLFFKITKVGFFPNGRKHLKVPDVEFSMMLGFRHECSEAKPNIKMGKLGHFWLG